MNANPCAPTSHLLKDSQDAYQRSSVPISGPVLEPLMNTHER
ncbi:MAG: hypothetical protein ACOVNQ_01200 [Pirellula sp.]